jgi:hypothetical protein
MFEVATQSNSCYGEAAHQEICDLQRISPEFAGRLMGNTSTLYTAKRTLTKATVKDFMQMNYIKAASRNTMIVGPTGVVKTFLSMLLGTTPAGGYSELCGSL